MKLVVAEAKNQSKGIAFLMQLSVFVKNTQRKIL